jgi:hypothetical protein
MLLTGKCSSYFTPVCVYIVKFRRATAAEVHENKKTRKTITKAMIKKEGENKGNAVRRSNLPKNVEQMYSEIWLPDRLDSEKWLSSLFSIRLN